MPNEGGDYDDQTRCTGFAMPHDRPAHKQPKVLKWLADHPRWTFHFTPTSASWLNAVEGFLSAITPPDPTRSLSLRRRSANRNRPIYRRT
jgi:transposase